MKLENVKLGHSPLTDTIFLYRHGKDPALALEKREAEADVMAVLVEHMMHDAPNGSEKLITLGKEQYLVRVSRVTPTPPEGEDGCEDADGLYAVETAGTGYDTPPQRGKALEAFERLCNWYDVPGCGYDIRNPEAAEIDVETVRRALVEPDVPEALEASLREKGYDLAELARVGCAVDDAFALVPILARALVQAQIH